MLAWLRQVRLVIPGMGGAEAEACTCNDPSQEGASHDARTAGMTDKPQRNGTDQSTSMTRLPDIQHPTHIMAHALDLPDVQLWKRAAPQHETEHTDINALGNAHPNALG